MIKLGYFKCLFLPICIFSLYRVRHLTFFFHLVLISWMVTISSCLIWQIRLVLSFRRTNMVVYTLEQRLEILRYIDLQKMPILAKKKHHLFKWSSFWSWRLCKQEKWPHLGHRKSARIHWKADAPKTSQCLVRILVQKHTFLRKWSKRGRYIKWGSLSGRVERIFVHKNWRGGYWQHLVSKAAIWVKLYSVINRKDCTFK